MGTPSGTGRMRMSATHEPQSTQSNCLVILDYSLECTTIFDRPHPQPLSRRREREETRSQYSRFVTMPGMGTGYLPSAPASSGAGESIVELVDAGGELVPAVEDAVVGDQPGRCGRPCGPSR